MRWILSLAVVPLIVNPVNAQTSATLCQKEIDALDATGKHYQSVYADYTKEGDDLKKKGSTFVDGTIDWKNTEMVFDLPSVTVKDQKLIFGVPQTTMKDQTIVFDTPSFKMVPMKTGQYPETTCEDTWVEAFGIKTKGVPKCTVKWSDIITNVPQPFMERHTIVMGIPEFKFDNTEIVMGIPEFKMVRQKWIMGLPQITVTSAAINSSGIKSDAESIKNRAAETQEAQKKDTIGGVSNLFACYRNDLAEKRKSADGTFNASVVQMDSVIQSLKASNADPTAIANADGTKTDLVTNRDKLVAQRIQVLKQFDDAMANLDQSEKDAIAKITSPTPATAT